MPYTERPDIAEIGAQAANNAVYGNAIIGAEDMSFLPPSTTIYVYNISQREMRANRPPNFPNFLIRACPADKPFLLVGTLTHPFPQREEDANLTPMVRYVNGYREASRLLSPLNPGEDQDFDEDSPLLDGGNLNKYGVFWSKLAPDDPKLLREVARFRSRMENTYRRELEKMTAVESRNPEEARLLANDISHAAASYFGVSTSWHRSDLVPKQAGQMNCWACAESIRSNAKICRFCGAPQDASLHDAWMKTKVPPEKRGPGRPHSEQ